MKKIWKIRRDEEAVSPVIATILMVAITVVLAAVLYIMVTTMTGGGQSTPMGSMNLKGDSNVNASAEKVYFGSINPTQKPSACKVIVELNGTKVGTYNFPLDQGTGPMTTTDGPLAIYYTDLAEDSIISDGDYLLLSGLPTGTTYKLILIWISNGSEICSQTFTK